LRGQAQRGIDDHGLGLLTFDEHASTRFWNGQAFYFGGFFVIGHGASKKNGRSILHQNSAKDQTTLASKGKSGASTATASRKCGGRYRPPIRSGVTDLIVMPGLTGYPCSPSKVSQVKSKNIRL
jgi:hypothetical protein